MAMLTGDRNTRSRGQPGRMHHLAQGTATTIYRGALVALNASGFAVPASTATGLRVIGRARFKSVNTGANGAVKVHVDEGDFEWNNSASADLINDDDIGKLAYVVDDNTVALTDGTGTRSAAGRISHVENGKPFVVSGLEVL